MKTIGKALLGLTTLVFLTIQFVPVKHRSNPPVVPGRSVENHLQIPPEISSILERACHNCHSNKTYWPWYGYVAPVSWMIAKDVAKGRSVLNFSEWSVQAGRKPEIAASMLSAACADVRIGKMPRFPYSILNPEAKLSPIEVSLFCQWTQAEEKRLIELKRKRQHTARLAAR